MFNGSRTDIPDHNGVYPIDVAKQLENPKIRMEVLKLLQVQSTSLKQFLNFESSLRKKKKSWLHLGIYFTIYILSFLVLFLFQFPLYNHIYQVYITIGMFVVATLCYLISIFRNPGYIDPNRETSFLVSDIFILFVFILSYSISHYRNCFN